MWFSLIKRHEWDAKWGWKIKIGTRVWKWREKERNGRWHTSMEISEIVNPEEHTSQNVKELWTPLSSSSYCSTRKPTAQSRYASTLLNRLPISFRDQLSGSRISFFMVDTLMRDHMQLWMSFFLKIDVLAWERLPWSSWDNCLFIYVNSQWCYATRFFGKHMKF